MNREEDKICKALMDWVYFNEHRYPCLKLFHKVDNEGKRKPWRAKQQGIRAGMPDYNMPVPTYDDRGGKYIGFWIEIKAPGKTPTEQQERKLSQLEVFGNYTTWSDDAIDAIEELEAYCKLVHRE